MARWTFSIKGLGIEEGISVRNGGGLIAESYTAEDAEQKRRDLFATCGDNLIVKIDGSKVDADQTLI